MLLLTARRNHRAKGVRVLAIVVTEAELIQVERQIIGAHVVIGADDSALQERPETLNIIGVDLPAHIFALTVIDGLMREAYRVQMRVAGMLVSRDEINLSAHGFANELAERTDISIFDYLADHVSLASNCADNGDLPAHPAYVLLFIPVSILILAADTSFVYFDHTRQRESVATHGCAPAMADVPASPPVSAGVLAKDSPSNLQRTHAFLANQHEITDFEPETKRDFGVLEDRSASYRETIAFPPATIRVAASPVERLLERIDSFTVTAITARTTHAIRPALRNDELFARFISRESPIKLLEGHHA